MSGLASCTRFSLRRLLHNRRFLLFTVLMPVGFYLLYSNMYGSLTRFDGTLWGAYFMISMAAFGAIGTTLTVAGTQTALDRESGWTKFLRLTPLSPWAYAAGQVVTAMAASLAVVALVLLTALAANALPFRFSYLTGGLAVWLGSLAFAAIGLTLAHLLDASTVGNGIVLIYLGGSFLGGLWTPLQVLPPVFRTLAAWMPSFHMADMGWHLLAGAAVPLADVAVLAACVAGFGSLAGCLYSRKG